MKFLCIGDPHFRTEELDELDSYIEQICKIIDENDLDFVVMLGDLLHDHEKINTLALNKACRFVSELCKRIETYLLVGNHDMINASQFLSENHWMNPLKSFPRVTVVDKLVSYESFLFLPFVPNGRFLEALGDTDLSSIKCIFAHQEFKGCKMGSIISETGDEWDLKYPTVITGHIHDKQQPQPNIIYVGSSRQHSFAEKADKSVSIFDNDLVRTEVFLDLPKKKIKYMNIDKAYNFEIPKDTNIKLKISIKCNQEEFKSFRKSDKYKQLIKSGIKVEYKKDTTLSLDTDDMTKNKDRISFYDILLKLTENESDIVKEIGKKYICGNN